MSEEIGTPAQEEVMAGRPPLRVGVAGLGRAALFDHLPQFKLLPQQFKLIAVCDLLKQRRDLVEKDFPGLHTYRRIEDMLDDPEIDLVDICLPTTEHVETALSALRRGKWTLVEAPLAVSHEDALKLKAAAQRVNGRLVAYTPGLFSPEFRLALQALEDPRLGELFEVRIRRQDYVRRDDWQSVKRCLGGCAWSDGPDALLQAVALLRSPPAQMWSELKRIAALGDAEDFAHIVLRSRGNMTADIELCGGQLAPYEPAFTVRGSRGTFTVQPGATEGRLHAIDPSFKFPRRRASVRTPTLDDLHESLPIIDAACQLPERADVGRTAFWRALYATIRTAAPFPVSLDDVVETVRYLQLVKKSSAFAK